MWEYYSSSKQGKFSQIVKEGEKQDFTNFVNTPPSTQSLQGCVSLVHLTEADPKCVKESK